MMHMVQNFFPPNSTWNSITMSNNFGWHNKPRFENFEQLD